METKIIGAEKIVVPEESAINTANELKATLLAAFDKLIASTDKAKIFQVIKHQAQIKIQNANFEEIKKLRNAAKLRDEETLSSDGESDDDVPTIAANNALDQEHKKALEKINGRHEKKLCKIQQIYDHKLLDLFVETMVVFSEFILSMHKKIGSRHPATSDSEAVSKDEPDEAEVDLQIFCKKIATLNEDSAAKDLEISKLTGQVKELSLQISTLEMIRAKVESASEKSAAIAGETDTNLAAAKARIIELEGRLKLQEPLFEVGVAARLGFITNLKRLIIRHNDHADLDIQESGHQIKEIKKARNDATHRGNLRADDALRVLGKVSKTDLYNVYEFGGQFALMR